MVSIIYIMSMGLYTHMPSVTIALFLQDGCHEHVLAALDEGLGMATSGNARASTSGPVWLLALSPTVWTALAALLAAVVHSTRIRALEWTPLSPIRRLGRRCPMR